MRHRASFICLLLLLTLLLSGWSSVIGAALCAHDAGQVSMTAAEHDCCRAQLEGPKQHCEMAMASAASSHEAMTMDEMEAMPPVVVERATETVAAINLPVAACQHCVSRSGLPTSLVVVTREPEQKKRDSLIINSPTPEPSASLAAFFTQNLFARQHAPPGASARRHLLLNVFTI